MKIKNIFKLLIILSLASSCNIIDKTLCRNYYSDDNYFRSSSEAQSSTQALSEEKALFIAKQELAVEVDNYIINKFGHKTFLEDPEFENKITTARKTVLQDINIICSRTKHRNNIFKTKMSIEMEKTSIDKIVKQNLNENIK